MALLLSYTGQSRFTYPTAYLRVTKVDLDVPASKASIECWIYGTAEIRAEDERATVERIILPVYDTPEDAAYTTFFGTAALSAEGMNPIAAAYLYLKSLGSFASATDV